MNSYEISDRRPIADMFREVAAGPTRWCVKAGIHPNTVSYASVAASLGAMICFLLSAGSPIVLLLGVGFCFLRLYFNMLDGMVAIASGKASATGEIANELPDRISDLLIFAGIGYSQLCSPDLALIVVSLSLLVAYVGTLGKASGAHRDFSGPMSKPWRMVALAVGIVVYVVSGYAGNLVIQSGALNVTLGLIAIGCIVTVVIRLRRIVTVLRRSDQENKSVAGAADASRNLSTAREHRSG